MSLKENILWTKEPSWNYYVGSHSFNTDRLLVHRSCLYFMWPFISTSTYSFLTLVKTIASSFMGLEEEMVKLISILVFHFFSGVFWPRPDLFGHGTTCSWLRCGEQEWNGQVQSCHVGCWRGEHVWYHFCYRGGEFGLISDHFHEGHLADWIRGYLGWKLARCQCWDDIIITTSIQPNQQAVSFCCFLSRHKLQARLP